MTRYPNSETITVVRSGGRDEWGAPTPSSVHQIEDVVRYPRGRVAATEQTDFQDTTITGYVLLIPEGADLLPTDRVRLEAEPAPQPDQDPWANAPWAVVSEVTGYRYPFSSDWQPGGVAVIERVT